MSKRNPDRGDRYNGSWSAGRVDRINFDATRGVWHFLTITGETETYCTRFTPGATIFIIDRFEEIDGQRIRFPGKPLRELITGELQGFTHDGAVFPWCPDCLSMAAVEAEMISQPAYPVQSLMEKLQILENTQKKA